MKSFLKLVLLASVAASTAHFAHAKEIDATSLMLGEGKIQAAMENTKLGLIQDIQDMRNSVIELQEQLNQKGFETGTPDGILGPGTRRAIGEFQHQQGMIADGFPGKEVLALLGVNIDAVKN